MLRLTSIRRRPFKTLGQAFAEYAVLIGLLVAALFGMQVYAQRGIQAEIKKAADGLSPFGADDPKGVLAQVEGMRYESGERRNRSIAAAGTVRTRQSAVNTATRRTLRTNETAGGGRGTVTDVDTTGTTGALGEGVSSVSEVVVDRR